MCFLCVILIVHGVLTYALYIQLTRNLEQRVNGVVRLNEIFYTVSVDKRRECVSECFESVRSSWINGFRMAVCMCSSVFIV